MVTATGCGESLVSEPDFGPRDRQKSLKPSGACERRQLSKLQRRKEIAWKDEKSHAKSFSQWFGNGPLKRSPENSASPTWPLASSARACRFRSRHAAIGPGCSQGRLPRRPPLDAFRDHDACSYERIERALEQGHGPVLQWGKVRAGGSRLRALPAALFLPRPTSLSGSGVMAAASGRPTRVATDPQALSFAGR